MPVVPFRGGRREYTQQIVTWLDQQPLVVLERIAKAVSMDIPEQQKDTMFNLWITLRSCPVDFCEALLTELRQQQQSASRQQPSVG